MKYNNEMSIIDNEKKAYLLGFIYGDGCISKYKERDGRIRYSTKISLQEEDSDILHKIKDEFNFFSLGKFDYSKYNTNSQKQVSLTKRSKDLFEDLKDNGVYASKSFKNKDKLLVPKIEKGLMRHFLRGLWDADGSFYSTTKRPNLLHSEICSASKGLIEEVDKVLIGEGIKTLGVRKKRNKKSFLYSITIVKTEDIQKLIDYLYKDSNIFLDRKYEKATNHNFVDKVKDRGIKCPKCYSIETTKNGTRNGNLRMKCKSCKKNFTIKNPSSHKIG